MEINKFTIHYIIFILASKFNFLFFHTSAHRFKTLPEITVTNGLHLPLVNLQRKQKRSIHYGKQKEEKGRNKFKCLSNNTPIVVVSPVTFQWYYFVSFCVLLKS